MRGDKYPVDKVWKDNTLFMGQQPGRKDGMGDVREGGEGEMPGAATVAFAIVHDKIRRAFIGLVKGRTAGGLLVCRCTVKQAWIRQGCHGQHEIQDDE